MGEDTGPAVLRRQLRQARDDVEVQVSEPLLLGEEHDVGPRATSHLDERSSRGPQQTAELGSFVVTEFVQPFNVAPGHKHQPTWKRRVERERQPPAVIDMHPLPRAKIVAGNVPLTYVAAVHRPIVVAGAFRSRIGHRSPGAATWALREPLEIRVASSGCSGADQGPIRFSIAELVALAALRHLAPGRIRVLQSLEDESREGRGGARCQVRMSRRQCSNHGATVTGAQLVA